MGTLTNLLDDATARFDVATDYDTDLGTEAAAKLGDKNNADDTLTNRTDELTPLESAYNGKEDDVTD